jgi:hypothetical protein
MCFWAFCDEDFCVKIRVNPWLKPWLFWRLTKVRREERVE